MAQFEETAAFREWGRLNPFERVLQDPCPLASGPGAHAFAHLRGRSICIRELLEIAETTLSAWKMCERSAMEELLLVQPTEFGPEPASNERKNQDQIDELLECYLDNDIEIRVEWYDWWKSDILSEPFPGDEVLPDGVEELLDEMRLDLHSEAEEDLWAVLAGDLPRLRYHRSSLIDAILKNREEWNRKFEARYASDCTDEDLIDWASAIETQWLELAVGARLIENWEDPLHVLAYRWEYEWIGTGNFIREVALAGIRLWSDRVCMLEASATNKGDFQALDRLAKLVLSETRRAFTSEAPSSHLGQSESTLVVSGFPFFADLPAETSIQELELRSEWDSISEEVKAEYEHRYEWFRSEKRRSAWREFGSLSGPPQVVEPDSICRALIVRFATRVVEEAAKFGRSNFPSPVGLKDENEGLEFVRLVVSDVLAFGTAHPINGVRAVSRFETLCIAPNRWEESVDGQESENDQKIDSDNEIQRTGSPLLSGQRKESSGKQERWKDAFQRIADDYLEACLDKKEHLKLKDWLKSKPPTYCKKATGFAFTTVYRAFTYSDNEAKWRPKLEEELLKSGIAIKHERTRKRTDKKSPTFET